MTRLIAALTASFLVVSPVAAQSSSPTASDSTKKAQTTEGQHPPSGCKPALSQPLSARAGSRAKGKTSSSETTASETTPLQTPPQTPDGTLTPAEERVQNIIAQDGVHVVHFWAPWCPNSTGELAKDWGRLVRSNPDVTFTFVTIWNEGASGRKTLEKHNVPERVVELTQPNPGEERLSSFLDRSVYWIPTTWIFHDGGKRAFAMNYGEMDMSTIQTLIGAARTEW